MTSYHDNTLTLTGPITSLTYIEGSLCITPGQPSSPRPSIDHDGRTWTMTLHCGRQGSSDVASAFVTAAGGSSVHVYAPAGGGGIPKKLNFFFGLVVGTAGGSATTFVGQGHYGMTNNWWIGGNGVITNGETLLAITKSAAIVGLYALSGGTSSFDLSAL